MVVNLLNGKSEKDSWRGFCGNKIMVWCAVENTEKTSSTHHAAEIWITGADEISTARIGE